MSQKVVIVGIGGASSSGKTTLAKLLYQVTQDSILIHQDDFYKSDSEIPIDKESGYQNWDCSDAINFTDFIEEVKYIKANGKESTHIKRYDSDTKDQLGLEFPNLDELKLRIDTLLKKRNIKLVFIDGFMLFHDPQIIQLFDLKMFLTASYETLKYRRYHRNGYKTQESFWVDPPDFFDKIVYPSYSKSHSYLFNDNNVEHSINQKLFKELDINTLKNDKDTVLSEVFDWGFDILLRYLESV